MNRRGFFRSLVATAAVALADKTRLGETALRIVEDPISVGQAYAEHLARSLVETKETLCANILNSYTMTRTWYDESGEIQQELVPSERFLKEFPDA